MNNQNTNPETLRKRNSKMRESTEHREARLAREKERKRLKRSRETEEVHETRLRSVRERRSQKHSMESTEERESRLNRENERKRDARVRVREQTRNETVEDRQNMNEPDRYVDAEQTLSDNEPNVQERAQRDNDYSAIPISATTISEEEHCLLKDFREKMDDIIYNLCIVCNERIPSMRLIRKMCQRCYSDKTIPKKFSAENNMDPG